MKTILTSASIKVITYYNREYNLIFENVFLTHKRWPNHMEYFFYYEEDIKKLHLVFGQPSVTELYVIFISYFESNNAVVVKNVFSPPDFFISTKVLMFSQRNVNSS